jgi:hypothetical protein
MQVTVDAAVPDWESFEFALESASPETQFYYDTVTGEVHLTGPFEDDPGERERIDADPWRYREVEPLGSTEVHEWMECFVAEVLDAPLRERLLRSLHGRGAFRRFKAELLAAPAERARWFCYHDQRLKRSLERWFEDHDVPVGAPPPWWPPSRPDVQRGGDESRPR